MKKILTFSFLIIAFSAFGQKESVSVQGGLNIAHITKNQFIGYSKKLAPAGGINYDVVLAKNILVGVGLHYTSKGFGFKNTIEGASIDSLWKSNYCYNFDYLSIPLRVGIVKGNKVKLVSYIALVPSVLMSSRLKPSGNIHPLTGDNIYTKELDAPFSDFELGLMVGTELHFPISNRLNLFPSVFYHHDITPFNDSNAKIKLRHWGVFVGLGLKYDFDESKSL